MTILGNSLERKIDQTQSTKKYAFIGISGKKLKYLFEYQIQITFVLYNCKSGQK